MMEDTTVPVGGGNAGGGGFFSNKRNLILLAAIGGGAAGLFIFLSRRSAPSAAGDSASGTTPYTQTDLQLQNLANQILQFRGESGQQIADLSTSVTSGQQAQAETSAAIQDTQDWQSKLLQTIYGTAYNTYVNQADAANTIDGIFNAIYGTDYGSGPIQLADGRILTFSPAVPAQGTTAGALTGASDNLGVRANQAPVGAGGFSSSEFLPNVYDGGDGSAEEWTALMSSGPVRAIGT